MRNRFGMPHGCEALDGTAAILVGPWQIGTRPPDQGVDNLKDNAAQRGRRFDVVFALAHFHKETGGEKHLFAFHQARSASRTCRTRSRSLYGALQSGKHDEGVFPMPESR